MNSKNYKSGKSGQNKKTNTPCLHEYSATLVCQIGIAGLIFLGTQASWAEGPNGPGVLRRPPPNPFANTGPNKQGGLPSRGYFDDEDDDDDDLDTFNEPMAPRPMPDRHAAPSRPQYPPANEAPVRTYSAGGSPNNAPEPVITSSGISIGGASANGVNSKSKLSPIQIDDETAEGSKAIVTDFNFPDADIMDIAKTLGKLTGKNFILDKDVKGKITIISNSPITVGEAWKVFLTALDINGFAIIPSGKYLRIARQRDARDKQLKTYTGDFSPDTDALISRVFPLKYISAEEVARTFRSFMPANSRIIPYEQTNTVIVTDTGSNISKLAKMLEILDVEGYDAGIEVVPVKFASAAELSKLIDALIPGTGGGAPGGPPGMPRFGGGGSKFSARRTKEGGIINTIIADERTNTLIVHANTKGADQVRELVAKLDQKLPSSTGGGKVHVVYLQFAEAEQIANTLNNFSQAASGVGARPPGGASSGTGVNPNAASLFEGSIKISPDKATNALVITASPSDFVTVQRVINRLDIPRDQVYIEVIIMEIQVARNSDFSANIISAPSLLGSVTNGTDVLNMFQPQNLFGSSGAILSFAGGSTTNLTISGQSVAVSSVQGMVRALQTNTNSNVLATPQIIALDNTEANFESAEMIPILTSTSIQGAGVAQSVTKESVAVSIKIKPQINKMSNFVKLDVTAKLGDLSPRILPKAVQDQAFATLNRTTQTTVVVGDSDTAVLGGLIRDNIQETVSKIPILGDIPILGWLFKSKTTKVDKRNLLIFLTPKIIRQYEKIRAILDKKLKERDDFIETNGGGEDTLRFQRDAMIRSLPDIKELTSQKPANTVTIDEEKPAAVTVGGPTTSTGTDSAPLNPEERIQGPLPAPNPMPPGMNPDPSVNMMVPNNSGFPETANPPPIGGQ